MFCPTDVKGVILAVEKAGLFGVDESGENKRFRTGCMIIPNRIEYKLCALPRLFDTVCTGLAQVLHMQTLLDLVNSGTQVCIKMRFFFDLFDGVYGCGVIFSAQLAGDLGKAEV